MTVSIIKEQEKDNTKQEDETLKNNTAQQNSDNGLEKDSKVDDSTKQNSNEGNLQDTTTRSIETFLTLVNNIRTQGCQCSGSKKAAVPPLKWSKELEIYAKEHSDYMAEKKAISHDNWSQRTQIIYKALNASAAAENVAWGSDTEKDTFNQWLQSGGHCENMMGESYTHIGVARNGIYWTMILARIK